MMIHSLYKNIPKTLTGVFLTFTFYFLARSLNGYSQDQEHLMVIANLALSVGLFAAAIPASLLLSDDTSASSNRSKLNIFVVCLTAVVLCLSLWMVFSKGIEGYFGFEYTPENSAALFLFLLLSSILISLIFLLNSTRGLTSNQVFGHWPLVLHFAACGIGLSLVFLLGLQSLGTGIQADATIVLSEFLRRLILVGIISQIVMTQIKRFSAPLRPNSLACLAGAILFLIGFQSTTLRIGGSEILYILNQASQLAGLGLIIAVTINVLARAWRAKTKDLLNQGLWVGHGAFLIGLTLTMISSGPFGFFALSGITQNFQLLLLAVATPLLMQSASHQNSLHPSQVRHLANALNWCGLFVCFLSVLVMSPFGGSLILVQNITFKPILSIMMSGMFLLILSYLISVWDRILHDWI